MLETGNCSNNNRINTTMYQKIKLFFAADQYREKLRQENYRQAQFCKKFRADYCWYTWKNFNITIDRQDGDIGETMVTTYEEYCHDMADNELVDNGRRVGTQLTSATLEIIDLEVSLKIMTIVSESTESMDEEKKITSDCRRSMINLKVLAKKINDSNYITGRTSAPRICGRGD